MVAGTVERAAGAAGLAAAQAAKERLPWRAVHAAPARRVGRSRRVAVEWGARASDARRGTSAAEAAANGRRWRIRE